MPVPPTPAVRVVPVPGYPGCFVKSWSLRERNAVIDSKDDVKVAVVVRLSLCDEHGNLALSTNDEAFERDGQEGQAIFREALALNGLLTTLAQEKKD